MTKWNWVFCSALAIAVSACTDEPVAEEDATTEAELASPAPVPLSRKGIWVWGSTVRGHEKAFTGWLDAHGFTDVFVLVKGVDGTPKYDVLAAMLRERSSKVRVWAWFVGFADASRANPKWNYLVGKWIAPNDPVYRAHLVDVVGAAIDPSRGRVGSVPDGVMLDDSFQWPSASYGGTTTARVDGLMGAVDAIKKGMSGVEERTHRRVLLGFSPHPETLTTPLAAGATAPISAPAAVAYGQDFGELGRRCDLIVPETYRYGMYPEPRAWIATVVSNVKKEITLEQGAARAAAVTIAPAFALYWSDTDTTPIAASDLKADRDVLGATAPHSFFRYTSGTINPGSGSDGRDQPTAAQIGAAIDGAP